MQSEPIDAVITWVDGNDPAHVDKLTNYFAEMGISRPEAAAPTRYNQCGEINYCVKSILKFTPWIRTIYIVTDGQTPPIMEQFVGTAQEEKIKLVDHRDIFCGFEEVLPTFNSLTIECLLWRIKGLSNNFIYFNDDCALIRPVSPENFFCGDKIVLRGQWRGQSDRKWVKRLFQQVLKKPQQRVKQELFRTIQEHTAKLAGLHKHFFQFLHAPFSLKKTTFENYFQENPELLFQNIRYAIRDQHQFWPISLIDYVEIDQKNVVFDNSLDAMMVNGGFHSLNKIQERLSFADKKENITFVCMQGVDEAPAATRAIMLDWLEKRIG